MSFYTEMHDERTGDLCHKILEACGDYDSPHNNFREAREDPNALAEITIGSLLGCEQKMQPITCVITATEEPILFGENRLQITIKSPIGKFISENLDKLHVGMKLPNNSVILNIAYVNSFN